MGTGGLGISPLKSKYCQLFSANSPVIPSNRECRLRNKYVETTNKIVSYFLDFL